MRISDWSSDVCSSDLADTEIAGDLHTIGNEGIRAVMRDGRRHRRPHQVGIMLPALQRLADVLHAHLVRREAVFLDRSEEHTSELQSLMRISYAVFCLKKKKNIKTLLDINIIKKNTLKKK